MSHASAAFVTALLSSAAVAATSDVPLASTVRLLPAEAQVDQPVVVQNHFEKADPYARTTVLEHTAMAMSVLHMTDNFLSRRSFGTDLVGTLTQLTYLVPVIFDWLDVGPILRIIDWAALLSGHLFGHYLAPPDGNTVASFHDRWAGGYDRLGVQSSAIGTASQAVLFTFDATMIAALVSNIGDGVEHGFTWMRVH